MFGISKIFCNLAALVDTLTICASKCFSSPCGMPIETPFEPYVRDKATNRGLFIGNNQANQTYATPAFGSGQYNYETKHSWVFYFSRGFFFFISYFLLRLVLFFIFSFETL